MIYYSTYEEAQHHKYNTLSTNPRYTFFKQTYFTAGDEEQFQSHRKRIQLTLTENTHHSPLPILCSKFSVYETSAVYNTFRYIFYKFKKGMFIQIKNNKVRVKLPFSNIRFKNEWSHLLKYNPERFTGWNDMFKQITEFDGYTFKPHRIHKYRNSWYAVNGIFRYEYPPNENGTGIDVLIHMLEELCRYYKVPDVECFINRKDYPLLTLDGTESYEALFGKNTPLLSYNYKVYSPILSMCVTDRHADLLIPATDEWVRICSEEQIYFPHTQYYIPLKPVDWNTKKPIAVFRGSSTGYGLTPETNTRLKLVLMDKEYDCIDVGFTKWNIRPRKDGEYVDIFSDDILETIQLKQPLTRQEQSEYKYIIHIDGHVAAYRLAIEMSFGSVLLKVDSPYKLWFSDRLKPYIHYVPIKSDLSDIITQIEWCRKNDDKCRLIAQNARDFYENHLQKKHLLLYLQRLFCSLIQK